MRPERVKGNKGNWRTAALDGLGRDRHDELAVERLAYDRWRDAVDSSCAISAMSSRYELGGGEYPVEG